MNLKQCTIGYKYLFLLGILCFSLVVQAKEVALFPKAVAKEYLPVSENSSEQAKTVKGVVTDKNGETMPGVTIVVKGSTIGTITDINGQYSIDVPSNATLQFSFMGYTTKEVLANKTTIDVTLAEDIQLLDEVVAVGYTTQKKADLTGAVSSVKMSSVNDLSASSIDNSIQGRMAGVTVMQNGGEPGAGASIRIRGLGTIGDNNPLYVIDGMPADNMNDINPGDIERIDVLKDASSAAIYGSRAANGVVIIQTKKGKNNGKINIVFNTYQGVASPIKKIDLLNAEQRNLIQSEGYRNDGESVPAYYSSDYAKITRTNWQNEVLDNSAYQANYDLSLSGGSEIAKYNVMASHLNQGGTLRGSGFERTTFRVNTEMNITKKLVFGENLMISKSTQTKVSDAGRYGALGAAIKYDPSIPVYDADGNYSGSNAGGAMGADVKNPMGVIGRSDDKTYRDRIFGNAYLRFNFFKNFTFKSDIGYDWSAIENKTFESRVPEAGITADHNYLIQGTEKDLRWIATNTLKYENQFGKHKLMALFGTSYENYNSTDLGTKGTDFISEVPSERYMESATSILNSWGGRQEWAMNSYFGRIDYAFADKYLFSANLRTDGSSKFAKGHRWGYFPSMSAGWRISEESFFKNAKNVVDNLKLRASWGTLGNQSVSSNYPTIPQTANTQDDYYVVFGKDGTPYPGRYATNVANENLQWEVTKQTDIGLDMTLWQHLDIVFDYYVKNTNNIIVDTPLPSLAGVTHSYTENAGKVRNRGYDFSVAYRTKIQDVDISIYGNLSSVKNEVLSLGNNVSGISASSYRGYQIARIEAGNPIGYFYGYKTDGIFKSEDEIKNYKDASGKQIQPYAKVGDIKFVDLDGKGGITDKDRTNIGSGFPDFTYGMGLDLAYKGFDFSMFWQGVSGYKILNASMWEGMFLTGPYNSFSGIMNRYDAIDNPNGSGPRLTFKDPNGNHAFSDYYVQNGDYIRLKNLTLGYSLNKKLIRRYGVDKLRFYATLQNMLTFTHYKGFDPEPGNNGNQMGVDMGQLPQPKTIMIGMNLNF